MHNQKYVDYLINTTKELEKYRESIHYKPVVLPVMQPKKVEKKVTKQESNKPKQPAKIQSREDLEVKPPVQNITPPPIKKK